MLTLTHVQKLGLQWQWYWVNAAGAVQELELHPGQPCNVLCRWCAQVDQHQQLAVRDEAVDAAAVATTASAVAAAAAAAVAELSTLAQDAAAMHGSTTSKWQEGGTASGLGGVHMQKRQPGSRAGGICMPCWARGARRQPGSECTTPYMTWQQ